MAKVLINWMFNFLIKLILFVVFLLCRGTYNRTMKLSFQLWEWVTIHNLTFLLLINLSNFEGGKKKQICFFPFSF